MEFQAVKGDITTVKADAIVLPANTALKEGSGASQAIFQKAGRKALTAACKSLAPVEVGSAIATPAFDLPAEYILHAVVPKWQGGAKNEYALLSSAYLSCLAIADAMDCESVAFPLLAAGNNGFNLRLAIQIAQESILSYKPENYLKKVFLVVYNEAAKIMMIQSGIPVNPMIPPEYFTPITMHKNELVKKTGVIGGIVDISKKVWAVHREQIIAAGIEIARTVLPDNKAVKIGLNIAETALKEATKKK